MSPFLPSELRTILSFQPTFGFNELTDIKGEQTNLGPVGIALQNDVRYALGDLFLSKVDRASMACSLESRAPFLALNVVELASRLPENRKVSYLRTKVALKEVALGRLPRETVLRNKRGFGIPVSRWLRGPLREFAISALSREKIERSSLISYQEVNRLLSEHLSRVHDNGAKLWTLIVFQLWCEKWILAPEATSDRPSPNSFHKSSSISDLAESKSQRLVVDTPGFHRKRG